MKLQSDKYYQNIHTVMLDESLNVLLSDPFVLNIHGDLNQLKQYKSAVIILLLFEEI